MDTRELEWFLVLAELQNVTHAADEIHVAQSTLSRAIRRVEADFGTPLFDRRGRRLTLNRYGQVVEPLIRQALSSLRRADTRLGEMTNPDRGIIRLGYNRWLGSTFIPQLMTRYLQMAPSARFVLNAASPQDVREDLLNGAVDFMFGRMPPADNKVEWHVITHTGIYLVVAHRHRLAKSKGKIRLANLINENIILPEITSGFRLIINRLCQQAGFTPKVAFESSHSQPNTMDALISAGLAVAMRWGPPPDGDEKLVYLPISDIDEVTTIGAAWIPNRWLSPAAVSFSDFLLSIESQQDEPITTGKAIDHLVT